MTAKEYLWKIQQNRIALAQIDEAVKTKRERIAELHQSIESISAITYDGPKVQTSPSDSMSEKVAKLVDLENETAEQISSMNAEALERSNQITDALSKIRNIGDSRYEHILFERYAKAEPTKFEQIAIDMGYDFDWVRQLHGQALKAFEHKYLNPTQKHTEL